MTTQNDLLHAIRIIVREENEPIRNDIYELKEKVSNIEQKQDNQGKDIKILNQKIDDLPERILNELLGPFATELEDHEKRITQLEKQNN